MAISNATQEFVLSVVDANIEFNSKIYLLLLLLIYFSVMFYISFRIDDSLSWWRKAAKWSMRLFSVVFLVGMPLFVLFLYRGFTLSNLILVIVGFYGIVLTIILLVAMVFGGETFFSMLGLKYVKTSRRRDLR